VVRVALQWPRFLKEAGKRQALVAPETIGGVRLMPSHFQWWQSPSALSCCSTKVTFMSEASPSILLKITVLVT